MQPAIYFQLGFFRTAVSKMYKVAIRMSPNQATTMAKSKTRWPLYTMKDKGQRGIVAFVFS
jgi:hypothetical protein